MQFKEIGNPNYIALETFRKSGVGVPTPVWAVAEGGKLYVWTVGDSGKVKRIRNNPRVRIAVSDARGAPKSEWVGAKARILDDLSSITAQEKRLTAKYGLQFRLIGLMSKLRRDKSVRVVIELSQI